MNFDYWFGFQDVYETFNVLMRRAPKENNFKAVLETIRTLMNTECVVPDWIHDIILGYGNPGAAHYTQYVLFVPSCLKFFQVMLMNLFSFVGCRMKFQLWTSTTHFWTWIICETVFQIMISRSRLMMSRNWSLHSGNFNHLLLNHKITPSLSRKY